MGALAYPSPERGGWPTKSAGWGFRAAIPPPGALRAPPSPASGAGIFSTHRNERRPYGAHLAFSAFALRGLLLGRQRGRRGGRRGFRGWGTLARCRLDRLTLRIR